MSKGLEALKSLFDTMPFAFLESNTMKDLKVIENELKHHEHNISTIIPNLVKTTKEQARVIEEQKKELKILDILKEICLEGKDKYGKDTWGWVEFNLDEEPKLKEWLKNDD